jgi:hypothetical protein
MMEPLFHTCLISHRGIGHHFHARFLSSAPKKILPPNQWRRVPSLCQMIHEYFRIWETPVMAPKLAAVSNIKTYIAKG